MDKLIQGKGYGVERHFQKIFQVYDGRTSNADHYK